MLFDHNVQIEVTIYNSLEYLIMNGFTDHDWDKLMWRYRHECTQEWHKSSHIKTKQTPKFDKKKEKEKEKLNRLKYMLIYGTNILFIDPPPPSPPSHKYMVCTFILDDENIDTFGQHLNVFNSSAQIQKNIRLPL